MHLILMSMVHFCTWYASVDDAFFTIWLDYAIWLFC